jgi:L-fucose isomerase-like protein
MDSASRLQAEKVLVVGGLPRRYLEQWEITADLGRVRDVLGVSVEEVPVEELTGACDALCDADRERAGRLCEELTGRAPDARGARPPSPAAVERAVRVYLAIEAILEARSGTAVTTVCGPIRRAIRAVPCVALMLLQERGIPAACQGDLDAMLTMLLFRRVAGVGSFMGGARREEGRLTVSHCVLSRRLAGADAPPASHYLGRYHDDLDSPTAHVSVPVGGPVTIARTTGNLEGLLLARGDLRGCLDEPGRCRNSLVIDLPNVEGLMAHVSGIQYHLVVAPGDHRDALAAFAGQVGMRAVRL